MFRWLRTYIARRRQLRAYRAYMRHVEAQERLLEYSQMKVLNESIESELRYAEEQAEREALRHWAAGHGRFPRMRR